VKDVRDDLRELLRRRADNVPPQRDVPRSLVGRARRRIALNAVGVGLALVVLAGGAWAGLQAFGSAPAHEPAGTGPPSSAQPAPSTSAQPPPSASAIPACTSAQLRAVGSMEGAAGSRDGSISLSNISDQTCTLQGTPTITLLDQNLDPITSGVTFSSSPPWWAVDQSPEPPGWPVVTLDPGRSALVRVRWGNWCPLGRAAPLWRMDIPGGGTVDVANGMEDAPPCNGPGFPSTIEEGPFEPATSS